jgi:membrane protein
MNTEPVSDAARQPQSTARTRLVRLCRLIDERAGGVPGALARAFRTFGESRASDGAASLAYYAFFSIFPLSLFLVAAGSFVLDSEQVFQQTVAVVGRLLPASGPLIEANLRQVMRLRGSVGLLGLAGLLWSGLSIFHVLEEHLSRAWPRAARRGYLRRSILALEMAGALAALLLLSLASSAIGSLLPSLRLPWLEQDGFFQTLVQFASSGLAPLLLSFVMYFTLYRWVPNARVGWREAAWAAAMAAVAWQAAIRGFTWYVASSLNQYELVYGSLGTVIALLFWVYLASTITLFGAHLAAALGHRRGD